MKKSRIYPKKKKQLSTSESPNMAKLYCALTYTPFSFATRKKYPNISSTMGYLRLGRCVINIFSNSTRTFAIADVEAISLNILLAILACHRFIMIHESSPGDSLPKTPLSDIVSLTKRKYSKMSFSELLRLVAISPELTKGMYFVIPRLISLDSSLSVTSMAKRLYVDYVQYMEYICSLSERKLLTKDGKAELSTLEVLVKDFLIQCIHQVANLFRLTR